MTLSKRSTSRPRSRPEGLAPAAKPGVAAPGEPVGYSRLIAEFDLSVLPPHRLTYLASLSGKHERSESGRIIVTLPRGYAPGPGVVDHLEFALKHEGLSLEILVALFKRIRRASFERELVQWVRSRPTGQYARRLWFLYEFLSGRTLPLEDVTTGNYIELLDPSRYFTGPGKRSRRQRVVDNLLGTPAFCPMVRRTPTLAALQEEDLRAQAEKIVKEFDEDTIRRAVSYLYTKETRSSFSIEGEKPTASRADRYGALLREVPHLEKMSADVLLRLQNETVDPRFADAQYRRDQIFVGEQVDLLRQKIHYIAPAPDDVPSLMAGLVALIERLAGSDVDPVVHAAVISYGFVFIHPFSDGNGRLHRLLIHYVLARAGFTPRGLIFPISAVMLARRREYDDSLEALSLPLMRMIDYDEDEEGRVIVNNDTANFYRYFDATTMAEFLYRWVRQTIRNDFRHELEFVLQFRATRQAIDALVELPDRLANLFIKLCAQNNGRLAEGKRKRHFSHLTDAEIAAMEKAVRSHLPRRP